MSGNSARIRLAASMPSVVNVGGIRMSVSTASGLCIATARCSASGSATVSTRSISSVSVSRPGHALAHEVVVVGEDDAHRHGLTVGPVTGFVGAVMLGP